MKSLFKYSKKEQRDLKVMSTKSKKLPKNFANQVLDYELQIDSGQVDIETVDKLMQLYSVSIFYSMEKFIKINFELLYIWQKCWSNLFLTIVSRWVLLRHERWKIHAFHRKNSKHFVKAWDLKIMQKLENWVEGQEGAANLKGRKG